MRMDGMWGIFRRMTPRERRLVGILLMIVGVILFAGTCVGTQVVFSDIEEEIESNAYMLNQMKLLAPRYAELSDAKRKVEEAIRNNKATSVRVAANEILKKLPISNEVSGATGTWLSDIVSFDGKTIETEVDVGKSSSASKKKGKSKDFTSGLLEVEQSMEFKEVPFKDLVVFLDMLESGKELLFVSRLELGRKFNNLAHVRASLSIVTYQYKGDSASEQE